MRAVAKYWEDIYTLMGRSSSVLVSVIFIGTILGLMDLGCIAMLVSLVRAVSQAQSAVSLTIFGISFSIHTFQLGMLLMGLYSVRALLGVYFYYTIYKRTGEIEASLKARLMERFTSMRYETRLKRATGSLIISLNQWTVTYGRSVLAPLMRFCCDAMVGMVILVYLFVLYPYVVFILFIFATMLGVTYDRTLKRSSVENARKFRTLSEEIGETSQQALGGYKEIRVLGLTAFFRDRILQRAQIMMRALAIATTISQSPRLIIEAVAVICGIGALLYFAHTSRDITHQLPQLAMLTFVAMRITTLISLTNSTISNLRLYRGVIGQLAEDCNAAAAVEVTSTQPVQPMHALFQSLEASHLTFAYEGVEQPVVSDLSFRITQGEAVVIIGASGSGKTTLVDLMLGILAPTQGQISVAVERDHKVKTQPDLMGVASYLSQTAFVLNDTLRRNVALGIADARIDDARVMDALRKAKLPEYAHANQLDTMLGDRGAKFSGGQRQRVVLARAFYHGHNVMVLDEATNAIDLSTEIEIVNDLLALRPDITLICISHRPEIAKLFPRVLDLTKVEAYAA